MTIRREPRTCVALIYLRLFVFFGVAVITYLLLPLQIFSLVVEIVFAVQMSHPEAQDVLVCFILVLKCLEMDGMKTKCPLSADRPHASPWTDRQTVF